MHRRVQSRIDLEKIRCPVGAIRKKLHAAQRNVAPPLCECFKGRPELPFVIFEIRMHPCFRTIAGVLRKCFVLIPAQDYIEASAAKRADNRYGMTMVAEQENLGAHGCASR